MARHKILVDLYKLNNPYVGLGQVSLHFGNALIAAWKNKSISDTELHLMTASPQLLDMYQDIYIKKPAASGRVFPALNRGFDIWHTPHQDSDWTPANGKGRYILTIHDLNFLLEKNMPKARYKLAQLQKKVDRADMVTAISHYTKTQIEEYIRLEEKSISVIYNGVEKPDVEKATKPASLPVDIPFFLTLCHLSPKKNTHVLLDLMKLLPDRHLVIAGANHTEYGEYIQKRLADESIKNVYLTGPVTNEEKAWLYQHCEAFFFPSLLEGFGLPVVEAMHLGKPVFIADKTSLPEVAGGHAYIWNSFEAEYMKTILHEGLTSENDMKKVARIQHAASFSWKQHAEMYMDIYRSLL